MADPEPGGIDEAARVHHAYRWCGGRPLRQARQAERVRRIGVFGGAESDPSVQPMSRRSGCAREAGVDGRQQLLIEYRWREGDADKMRRQAAELAALAPDVIFVRRPRPRAVASSDQSGAGCVRDCPDPVGSGFVESLSRPGGNATGFMMFEYSLSGNGWSCSKRSRRT